MTECEGLDDSAITCQKRLDRCSPDNFGTIPRPALLIKIDPSRFSGQISCCHLFLCTGPVMILRYGPSLCLPDLPASGAGDTFVRVKNPGIGGDDGELQRIT